MMNKCKSSCLKLQTSEDGNKTKQPLSVRIDFTKIQQEV